LRLTYPSKNFQATYARDVRTRPEISSNDHLTHAHFSKVRDKERTFCEARMAIGVRLCRLKLKTSTEVGGVKNEVLICSTLQPTTQG
jgi:hypothetical protein